MRRSYRFFGLFTALSLLGVTAVNSSALMKRAEWFYELCGVERWSVKTGTDADVSKINLSAPTATTIASMTAFPAQSSPPANNRISPYETTLWTVDATLIEFKAESDEDYHLVLKDAAGNTMIAEIPAPHCVGSSPLLAGVTNARRQFDAKYNASSSFQTVNIPVRVQGVGMFDFAHGQTGAAPNQIELHPVISIIFNPTGGGSAPAAPTSLSALAGIGKVSLAWNASTGATTYNLYRSNSTGTESTYLTGLTATTYTDSGLTAGTTYYYKVTAANSSGESPKSNEASATPTSAGSAPAAPTGLSAAAGNAQIALTWTASTGATTYTLYRSNSSGTETSYRTGLTATSFTDTALTNGTAYYYKVTAVNSIGESAKSNEANAAPTSGGGTAQLLLNPGFESGATVWTAASGVIDNGTSEAAHTGAYKAWLCGYGATHTDTLYQTVTIPSTITTATLTFWLHIDTAETTTSTVYDTLNVQIRNGSGTVLTTLATYSNLSAASGYAQKSFNVAAYKGQTIEVYLVGAEDSSSQTSFVVDDFALNVQ